MSESKSDPHPDPHADPHADPGNSPTKLTPLESYFDTLFNQHMVVPEPEEVAPPVDDVDDQDRTGLKG